MTSPSPALPLAPALPDPRRRFIGRLAGAGAALSLARWHGAWAQAGAEPVDRPLVVVLLRGAIDGLSVVVPHDEPDYYRLRPDIAIARPGQDQGAIALDRRFGLHPSLAMLMPLWEAQQLAFVQAAGSPDPTRSHFDAQDNLETGTPGRHGGDSGWLNRLAGLLPGPPSRMRTVGVGQVAPRILSGPVPVAALGSGNDAVKPGVLDRGQLGAAFQQMYAGDDAIARTLREGTATRGEMRASLESAERSPDNGATPVRGMAQDATRLGQLMRRDPRVALGFMAVGGWDTHVNQGAASGVLATRLRQLGEGLAALMAALGERAGQTTIVVMSEFGRTVAQNGNRGTDHGHGNLIWLLGGAVAGGQVAGQWPGLAQAALYQGRDLAVTTDFRQVLGDVCRHHLRLDQAALQQLFPDAPATSLPVSLIRS